MLPAVLWVFTPTGFPSIVADHDVPGHALVRARVLGDLESFCARTGAPLPTETPHRDYRYRTSVPFSTLAADLAAQAQGIDYPNFKNEVSELQGSERAAAYGRIWAVMHELQERTARRHWR